MSGVNHLLLSRILFTYVFSAESLRLALVCTDVSIGKENITNDDRWEVMKPEMGEFLLLFKSGELLRGKRSIFQRGRR